MEKRGNNRSFGLTLFRVSVTLPVNGGAQRRGIAGEFFLEILLEEFLEFLSELGIDLGQSPLPFHVGIDVTLLRGDRLGEQGLGIVEADVFHAVEGTVHRPRVME